MIFKHTVIECQSMARVAQIPCVVNANQLGFNSREVWIFISRLRPGPAPQCQGGPGLTKYSPIIITREKLPLATECRVSLIMAMFGSHLLNSLHLPAAVFAAVTAMGR